jgi:hypothetical protein
MRSSLHLVLALCEPRMIHGLLGVRSSKRIDLKEPSHEVNELVIIGTNPLLEGGLLGDQDVHLQLFVVISDLLLPLTWMNSILIFFVVIWCLHVDQAFSGEEVADELAFFHHVFRNGTQDTDYSSEETLYGVILEQDVARVKLSEDAAERPHINLVVILAAQDNFRSSV